MLTSADCVFSRWETPLSNAELPSIVSLTYTGDLSLVAQDLRDPSRRRFQFDFGPVPYFLNVLEEYRSTLTVTLQQRRQQLGWTLQVKNSEALKEFALLEPLLELYHPKLNHYLIYTEFDALEVLSSEPVQWHELSGQAATHLQAAEPSRAALQGLAIDHQKA